eukprot:scaffold532_cov216-Ochromonas_danica.AAC.4
MHVREVMLRTVSFPGSSLCFEAVGSELRRWTPSSSYMPEIGDSLSPGTAGPGPPLGCEELEGAPTSSEGPVWTSFGVLRFLEAVFLAQSSLFSRHFS